MKKLHSALFLSLVLLFVLGCAPSNDNRSEKSVQSIAPANVSAEEVADEAAAPTEIASYISSSAAIEKGSDTSRRFIRTAELRFRVKDVIKTTYKIEDITKLNGGFVAYSNVTSAVDYEENKSLTADSTLIITHFTINNTLTLRIVNTKLDTVLKQIAPLIEFLDYRIINAKDLALDILTNRLTQIRARKHDERLSKVVEGKAGKSAEITSAAESLLKSQESADQALISDLSLKDQIKYSTISIQMYQRQTVKYSVVANEKNFKAYEPEFFSKLWDALQTGFDFLKEFILVLFRLWWLILIVIAAFLIYPKIRKRKPPLV